MENVYVCLMDQLKYLTLALKSSGSRIMMLIAAFLAPIQGIMITVAICILADTVMGIWKANKLNEKVTSRKLSQIISKMFLYQATVVLIFAIDKFILDGIIQQFFTVPLLSTKLVALTLISIELFSIDENFKAVKKKGFWDYFKDLTSRAKEVKDEIDPLK
jgi:Bacteriophage holin family